MVCKNCSAENPQGAKFYIQCAAPFEHRLSKVRCRKPTRSQVLRTMCGATRLCRSKCVRSSSQHRHRLEIGVLATGFQFRSPGIDRLDVEPPIAANAESWDLSAFEQPINGGRVYMQIARYLLQRHHLSRSCLESIVYLVSHNVLLSSWIEHFSWHGRPRS
jgi:hypothetical protein